MTHGVGELLAAVHDPVADGVDVVPAVDALDLGRRLLHPGFDPHHGGPMVEDGLDRFDRPAALGLEVDDRFLGPDLLDEALGDAAVAVGFEELEVGVDDLELDGRAAAVQDEDVHECHLSFMVFMMGST